MTIRASALAGFLAVLASMPALASGDRAEGKKLSAQCAQCHGADGNSTVAQFPRLAGQYADYIVRALTDYAGGARSNPVMGAIAKTLSEEQREALAAYFSAQQGLSTVKRP